MWYSNMLQLIAKPLVVPGGSALLTAGMCSSEKCVHLLVLCCFQAGQYPHCSRLLLVTCRRFMVLDSLQLQF